MFDLEGHIERWRQSLPTDLADRPEVVDELESHLRDELDRLLRAGRPAEQAWDAAVAGLGDPRRLAEEFARAPRAPWLPARLSLALPVTCALLLGAFLSVRLYHGRVGLLLAAHVLAVATGYVATLAVGLSAMAAIFARARGNFGARQDHALRWSGTRVSAAAAVLTMLGVVLGAFWSCRHLGHYWQWDPREVGGLCVLGWNCVVLLCLRWSAVPAASAALAGVVGNVVVALSWFGPPLMDAQRSVGFPTFHVPLLCGFVFAQLAWLYAGLLPPGWLTFGRVHDKRVA